MPGQFGKDGSGDPDNVASYVATLSADLAMMARRHGLDTLGYLLDMARLEAENLTRPAPERGSSR